MDKQHIHDYFQGIKEEHSGYDYYYGISLDYEGSYYVATLYSDTMDFGTLFDIALQTNRKTSHLDNMFVVVAGNKG